MSDILTPEQMHTLLANAMGDPALRQALLDNPHAVVQQQFGLEVPAGKTLHVIPGDARMLAIIIPQRPVDGPDDLSAEAVANHLEIDLNALDDKARKMVEMQTQLIAKAWRDESFKQRLLSDPRGTVSQELDVDLPDDFTLQCFANETDHQYLVLPLALEALELTDEQLESVAGGEAALIITAVTATVAISAQVVSYTTSW